MSAISPELVLVDPELAAVARAGLHDPGRFRPGSEPRAHPATATRAPETAPQLRPTAARAGRGLRGAVVLGVGAAMAAAVALGLTAGMWDRGATRTPASDAAPQSLLRARAARQTGAARTYTWPAVPGAEVYEITIMRGATAVYEATTRAPTLRLPEELALSPGRYTLSATPQSDSSSPDPAARPVVEETFQVTSF